MKVPYLTLNTDAVRSSSGKTFVYVLMLNVNDEHKPVPFYVGRTKNLTLRFSNHKNIAWHYNTFQRPVSIWVAGTVKDVLVDDAELELKSMLSQQGYFLVDSGLQKTWSTSLKDMNSELVNDYVDAVQSKKSIVKQWQSKWCKETSNDTTSVHASVLQEQNKTLVDIVSQQKFYSAKEHSLAVSIAEQYDAKKDISRVAFKDVDLESDSAALKAVINKIRHVWILERKLELHTFNSFKMTRRIKNELLKAQKFATEDSESSTHE